MRIQAYERKFGYSINVKFPRIVKYQERKWNLAMNEHRQSTSEEVEILLYYLKQGNAKKNVEWNGIITENKQHGVLQKISEAFFKSNTWRFWWANKRHSDKKVLFCIWKIKLKISTLSPVFSLYNTNTSNPQARR